MKHKGLIALAAVLAVIPVQAAGKGDIDSAKDKISSLEEEKKKTEETIQELEKLKADTESYVKPGSYLRPLPARYWG